MPPKPDQALLEAVERYLRLGWTVMPLCWPTNRGSCGCGRGHEGREIGKAPLTDNEGRLIIFGPEQLEEALRYWTIRPANIGIRVAESGLVVLDYDGGPPDGWDSWVRTSRGGHVYAARGPLPQHASNAEVEYGGHRVDVRAVGYVVAPPSLHESGRRYEWVGTPKVYELPEEIRRVLLSRANEMREAVERELPDRFPKVNVDDLPIPEWLYELIVYGRPPQGMRQYPSRSEAEMAAIAGLVRYTDLTDVEIAGILLNPAYAISEKPLQRKSIKVLLAEIEKARRLPAKSDAQPKTSETPSDSQDSGEEDLLAKHNIVLVPVSRLRRRELSWVVEGLIPAYGMVGWIGRARVGKSRLVRHLIACLQDGSDFLGFPVTRKFRVLYIVSPQEATNNELKDNFEKLGCDVTVMAHQRDGEAVHLLSHPIGDEFVDTVRQALRKDPHDIVILDTLGRYMYTKEVEQNDHISMALMNQRLVRLAEDVVCLINVTHSKRKEEYENASEAMPGPDTNTGAYQASLLITAKRDPETDLILYHTLSVDLRGTEPPPKMYLLYDNDTARFRVVSKEEVEALRDPSRERREAILKFLAERGGASRQEISEHVASLFDVSPRTVDRDLQALLREGRVMREGSTRNATYKPWRAIPVNLREEE